MVPSSRDYVFKCRHFNAAWLKKNPNARASVVNKVIVTTCRMPPECTAIDLYDRLKLLFQRHLTFPDEVEREEADGTPGGLWEVQYAVSTLSIPPVSIPEYIVNGLSRSELCLKTGLP